MLWKSKITTTLDFPCFYINTVTNQLFLYHMIHTKAYNLENNTYRQVQKNVITEYYSQMDFWFSDSVIIC